MAAGESGLVHVVLAFDDNFWAPAATTIRAIILASRLPSSLRFHLIHPQLSKAHLENLDDIESEFGAHLRHYDPADVPAFLKFSAELSYSRHISPIAGARLFLDQFLDPTIDRVVYLDCDLHVRGPVEDLASIDLAGLPVGAVKDPGGLMAAFSRDIARRRDLFDPADPYFNSGVLVIDLSAWRAMNLTSQVLKLQRNGTLSRIRGDQQVLNFILKGRWRRLDETWNALACGRDMEALEPKIVHFVGLGKPWNLFAIQPYGADYRRMMGQRLFWAFMRHRWARWWLSLPRRILGRR